MSAPTALPRWADLLLAPALALGAAVAAAGLVLLALGEPPLEALRLMASGSLGSAEGVGFTLYYATSFAFAGLSVALAYHAGLFNIGAEGQATLGGVGIALPCLGAEGLPGLLLVPLAILAGAALGALWGLIPGYLYARRGSHVVITTIMLNFLASILLVTLLVDVIGRPGSMAVETRPFPPEARLPALHDVLPGLAPTPLNLSAALALACALAVWLLVQRTRAGYAIRVVGANPLAAAYAGIDAPRVAMLAMALSGALASGVAVNEILGVQHRLLLDFTGGAGFLGIAVALMGRAHPAGILIASLLFGALAQGGAELAFEKPAITRDMVLVIGGIVIFFAGALDGLFRGLAGRFVRA